MDSRSYKFPLMPRLQGNIYLRWVTPEVALGISELNNYLRPQAAQQDPDSWGYFFIMFNRSFVFGLFQYCTNLQKYVLN